MQLTKSDALFDIQSVIWRSIGLTSCTKPALGQCSLETCLAAARTVCLTKDELDQLPSPAGIKHPLNPRNEAAALALLLVHKQDVCGSSRDRQQQLLDLVDKYPHTQYFSYSRPAAGSGVHGQQLHRSLLHQPYPQDSPEANIFRWAQSQGAKSALAPAVFRGTTTATSASCGLNNSPATTLDTLRGCAAVMDVQPGDILLEVPEQLLITYATAADSDFGQALSRIPGLDPETLAVLWTMVDRHDYDSPHAPFWSALPAGFHTLLSAPQAVVDLLKGLPLYLEASSTRAHLQQQFDALQQTIQVLLTAYAAFLEPHWFSKESYLWAVELWYAYAIQVKGSDGHIQPALVPLATLINHSPRPHVVHYSTVNPQTSNLELKCFRSIDKDEQVFLSYGPLPNSQLLLFYGFAVADNPFGSLELEIKPSDVVQLLQQRSRQQVGKLSPEQQQQQQQQQQEVVDTMPTKLQLLQDLRIPTTCKLSPHQPLPQEVLYCLRLLCACAHDLQQMQTAVQAFRQQLEREGAAVVPAQSQAGNPERSMRLAAEDGSTPATALGQPQASRSTSGAGQRGPSLAAVQQRWSAVALHAEVLGRPLNDVNEQAVVAVLQQLLAAAKAPAQACMDKLRKRQQLQAMLRSQGSDVLRPEHVSEGVVAAVQVFLQDVLDLFDSCTAAARHNGN